MDITVTGLTKLYDGKRVLDGFSAVFPGGQTSCIMGKSGCGKTTLLNILMGFVKPDGGSVTGVPKKLAAVFQEDRLLENFSGALNAGFAAPRAGAEEIRRHLADVGLGADAMLPVREMSGGMKRRVALVRAVLARGDALFLDEPFKGLDGDTRQQVIRYLVRETKGITTIVVTHSAEETELLGGRLVRMTPESEETDED